MIKIRCLLDLQFAYIVLKIQVDHLVPVATKQHDLVLVHGDVAHKLALVDGAECPQGAEMLVLVVDDIQAVASSNKVNVAELELLEASDRPILELFLADIVKIAVE